MKKDYTDFLKTVLMSAGIGLVIAFVEIVVKNFSAEIIFNIVRNMLIGAVIGSLSQLAFVYVYDIRQKPPEYAFATTFILIATISSTPFIYYYLTYKTTSVVLLLAIIGLAEVLGMSLCYFSFKKSLQYSQKLNEKKQILQSTTDRN